MQATSVKVQTAFRFDKELVRRLKIKAKKENRSLNNYVETVLMDIVYDEPNDETIEAINEVRSGLTKSAAARTSKSWIRRSLMSS